MKTPHAILIGLSLIAAAIFFKDIMTPPAHARWTPGTTSPALSCPNWHWCYVLDNKTIARIKVSDYEKCQLHIKRAWVLKEMQPCL